jgi:hypothetical protein
MIIKRLPGAVPGLHFAACVCRVLERVALLPWRQGQSTL